MFIQTFLGFLWAADGRVEYCWLTEPEFKSFAESGVVCGYSRALCWNLILYSGNNLFSPYGCSYSISFFTSLWRFLSLVGARQRLMPKADAFLHLQRAGSDHTQHTCSLTMAPGGQYFRSSHLSSRLEGPEGL